MTSGPAAQVTINQAREGQPMANVIALILPGGAGTPSNLDIAMGVAAAWEGTDRQAGLQSQDIDYISLAVRRLDEESPTDIFAWGDVGSILTGRVTQQAVDPGSCLGYTLRTAVAGKSNRGRIYIGGVARSFLNTTATAWKDSGTGFGDLRDCMDNFIAALVLSDLTLGIFSRKLDSIREVTSTVFRTSLLSQNPRARRYGVV